LAKPCIRKKLLAKKKKRRVTRCERAGLGFGGHYSYLVLHFDKLSVNSLCIALNKRYSPMGDYTSPLKRRGGLRVSLNWVNLRV